MEYYAELIFHFGCCNAENRKGTLAFSEKSDLKKTDYSLFF